MNRTVLTLFTMLLLSPSAFASNIVKVMDGSVAYCNENTARSHNKFVSLSLLDESSSNENKEVTVRVSLVKCHEGQWVADPTPSSEKYVAPNGVKVNTKFSNYELLVVDKDYRVLLKAPLQDLNKGSFQDRSVSLNKNDLPQAYELIIRSQRNLSAANGVTYSERINFGIFRLHAQ